MGVAVGLLDDGKFDGVKVVGELDGLSVVGLLVVESDTTLSVTV